jgi:hypothetical protein
MQVVFRCKRSGNTVSFSLPADIDGLRKHEGYEEVRDLVEAENAVQEIQRQETASQVIEPVVIEPEVPVIRVSKAKGRPRKVKE